jgi:transcriptional regulator with PAS, ATPase and Fis domain
VDLRHAVNRGTFREDLYFRMAQVTVEIPPLRKRMDDLPVLVEDILQQLERPHMKVDKAGMSALPCRTAGRATFASCERSFKPRWWNPMVTV